MAVAAVSDRSRLALAREREVVAARLADLQEQSRRLRALADGIDREIEETSHVLRGLDELVGLAPPVPLDADDGELGGRRLRELAVELLRARKGSGAAVHYTEWYELLRETGARVAGKDPLATFLTQVSRSPDVESVRPRSGFYRLRAAA